VFTAGEGDQYARAVESGTALDFINAFNHRNFGNPVSIMSSPIFGQNTSGPGGRSMLGSLKIKF
jgi:hypothetical protein